MGYIQFDEQKRVELLYGYRARYRCNECNLPIYIHEEANAQMVTDSKGGYVKVISATPIPSFLPKREPKVTYHVACDPKKDLHVRPQRNVSNDGISSSGQVNKLKHKIVEAIRKKPRKDYWDVGTVFRKVFPDMKEKEKPLVRKLIRDMRTDGSLIRKGHYMYLPKEKKK